MAGLSDEHAIFQEIESFGETGISTSELALKFDVSRQSAYSKLKQYVKKRILKELGAGRNTRYSMKTNVAFYHLDLSKFDEEYSVYKQFIQPILEEVACNENALDNWMYGFTEMYNNAIDHSEGANVDLEILYDMAQVTVRLRDDGIGIFKKIQDKFNLPDARQALFQLTIGKLTTDPANHTGEGIFFSSKIFDFFSIEANGLCFVHKRNYIDCLFGDNPEKQGTEIIMKLGNQSDEATSAYFDKFAAEGENDYSFSRTIVPLKLAINEGDKLISRSQAKRLVARFDNFEYVLLDFEGVQEIGQAFSDQLFRVYATSHPNVQLLPVNANQGIEKMINRVRKVIKEN